MSHPRRNASRRSAGTELAKWLVRRTARVLEWLTAARWHAVVASAGIGAALGATVLGVYGGVEYLLVQGWPVEQARIVASVDTGTTESCGKSSAEVYRETWESANPPVSLPARFLWKEGCGAATPGEVLPVVRVVQKDGFVHVWVNPTTSGSAVARLTGIGALSGIALALLLLAVGGLPWRAQGRHHTPPTPARRGNPTLTRR